MKKKECFFLFFAVFLLFGCFPKQEYVLLNNTDNDIQVEGFYHMPTYANGSYLMPQLVLLKSNKCRFTIANVPFNGDMQVVSRDLCYLVTLDDSVYRRRVPYNTIYDWTFAVNTITNSYYKKDGKYKRNSLFKLRAFRMPFKVSVSPGGYLCYGFRRHVFWKSLKKKDTYMYSVFTPMKIISGSDTTSFDFCEIHDVPDKLKPKIKGRTIKGMIVNMEVNQ